jgi:hypothetical protein
MWVSPIICADREGIFLIDREKPTNLIRRGQQLLSIFSDLQTLLHAALKLNLFFRSILLHQGSTGKKIRATMPLLSIIFSSSKHADFLNKSSAKATLHAHMVDHHF